MKYKIKAFFLLLLSVVFLGSCMKGNEEDANPYCAITAFSVSSFSGTVNSVKKTLTGSEFIFRIDQNKGEIYNLDTLPHWVNLKIVPTFSCYGVVSILKNGEAYGITSGSDSIDVSSPDTLRVFSTDGSYTRDYILSVRKAAESSQVEWTESTSNLKLCANHKIVACGAVVYAFSEDNDKTMVSYASNPENWTMAELPLNLNVETVIVHDKKLYAISTDDDYMYNSSDGLNWQKADETKLYKFLSSDGASIFSYNGNYIVSSNDGGMSWQENIIPDYSVDLDSLLPEMDVYSFSRNSSSNDGSVISVMGGTSSKHLKNAVCWYKLSNVGGKDSYWAYMEVTEENSYALPPFAYLSVFRYGEDLYALGMGLDDDYTFNFNFVNNSASAQKAVGLYQSRDNGLTWWRQDSKWLLPLDLYAADGSASIAVVGNTLWLVQATENGNGKVWIGNVR